MSSKRELEAWRDEALGALIQARKTAAIARKQRKALKDIRDVIREDWGTERADTLYNKIYVIVQGALDD